jgi:peptide/nickel transport system substrate-binding protein
VEITLGEPNALLPAAVANVKILDMKALDTINKEPVVTGPFRVGEFVPDDHVTLVRNEAYTGEPPSLDEIRLVKAPDGTSAFTSLRSGDLDVLWSVPQANVSQLEHDQELKIVKPEIASQYVSWEVDTTSAPFDDVRARQALAYATDREAILKAAYFGQGVVSPTNTPLAPENPWFDGELQEYGYDLDKAKQLFAEAGVKEGDTLTWWGVAGQYPEWNTSGQILQASLKEIGIELKIQNNEISTWAEKFYPAGKKYPGLIVPNFQSVPPEPAFSINFLLEGRCECNWSSPEFEKEFAAAVAEPDEEARKERWARVQEIINREAPLIIPVQATVATATKQDIDGIWTEGGGQLHLEAAGRTGGK